jgi:hypothetical protein
MKTAGFTIHIIGMVGLSAVLATGAMAQTDNPFVRGLQNAADVA